MGHDYFPTQFSVLSTEALTDRVLSKYSLETPIECLLFQSGINDIYLVKSGSASYYLRVSRENWKTPGDIKEEIDLLNRLHDDGIPVAMPVEKKDGEYLYIIETGEGLRTAVLFVEAKGVPLDIADDEQNYMFGQLLGRMHCCADKIDTAYVRPPLDLKTLLDEPVDRLTPFLANYPKDLDYLMELGNKLKSSIAGLGREKPGFGICHGDLHNRNVHFDKNGKPTLFDFDSFGYSWRIYDIAVYVFNMIFDQRVESDQLNWMDCFSSFLTGYCEEYDITNDQLNLMHSFLLVYLVWRMGLHVTASEYKGIGFINKEYFDQTFEVIRNLIKRFNII